MEDAYTPVKNQILYLCQLTNDDVDHDLARLVQEVKSRRIQLGLTQKDVARLSGMSSATVQRFETGLYFPKGNYVMAIKHALQLPETE